MNYKTYLTACAIMHKVELIEKAIEYMETIPVSTECYNAIIDMLKYEKEGLIDDFIKLADNSAGDTIGRCTKELKKEIKETDEMKSKINVADLCWPRQQDMFVPKTDKREVDEVFC